MIIALSNRHLNNSSDAEKFLADVQELWNHMKNKKSVVDEFTLHLDANIPVDWLKNIKLIFTKHIFPKTLHLNIGDPSVFKHLIDTRGALDFDPKTKVNIDARMIHDKTWKQPSEKRFVEFLIGKHSAIAFNRERIHVHVLAGNIRTIFLNLGLALLDDNNQPAYFFQEIQFKLQHAGSTNPHPLIEEEFLTKSDYLEFVDDEDRTEYDNGPYDSKKGYYETNFNTNADLMLLKHVTQDHTLLTLNMHYH
uniref:DUF38 domain-containing protein n=1 Tax=Acrobeloides nanus TaxID=290746 RepID=A0A914DXG9_9BILA